MNLVALIGGGAMVLTIIGLLVALVLKSSGEDGPETQPTGPVTTSPAAQLTTPPTGQPTTSSTVQPSGQVIQLPAGVTVVVPAGWTASHDEGGNQVTLHSEQDGTNIIIVSGQGEEGAEPSNAMQTLTLFQTQYFETVGPVSYEDVQITGPDYQDVTDPITSHASLTFTATWIDTTGEGFPRAGRMDCAVRTDASGLLIAVEAQGDRFLETQSSWGPIVDGALQSFAAPG